jgi:hypothetical protein
VKQYRQLASECRRVAKTLSAIASFPRKPGVACAAQAKTLFPGRKRTVPSPMSEAAMALFADGGTRAVSRELTARKP